MPGESFLPRIESVFFAVFDIRQGPKIIYQVPEGLISTSVQPPFPSLPPTPSSETGPVIQIPSLGSRNSSNSIASPNDVRPASRIIHSPHKRSISSSKILFNFDDISKYVIPPSPLCGRLVTCSTMNHRVIGVPVQLNHSKYREIRNYFRFNLCFVFERTADLSCYEPVVRKVSRVLTSCEEESAFLSSPSHSQALHGIIEQLYEDLNSYSETSIPIDQFNSIELKIFPFYPNPLLVSDWMVPVALINLSKRIEENWDLTMVKVCAFIDGTNHVARIAHLAECDLKLTREAISHLLYYQVIMTIDIFAYSNSYMLRKSIQWLSDEPHVKEECGPYIVKPGATSPPWSVLLYLYSRMKPGVTVSDWMEAHGVEQLGIDVRRFTSFGVIKGFLRRVHRYPFLPQGQQQDSVLPDPPAHPARTRINSVSGASFRFSLFIPPSPATPVETAPPGILRNRTPAPLTSSPGMASDGPNGAMSRRASLIGPSQAPREASAAEKVLEKVRNRDRTLQQSLHQSTGVRVPSKSPTRSTIPPDHSPIPQLQPPRGASDLRRRSVISPSTAAPPNSPTIAKKGLPSRPKISQPPATSAAPTVYTSTYPPDLLALLDGEHHTDELSVRFESGWPLLERWLVTIGGGQGSGDFGRVSLIYR